MNNQRKRVLTFLGVWLVIGTGFGLYALFQWVIPFMDTVLFPWMAHWERTLGRSTGLAVFLGAVIAICGALIALWVRYVRAVRARLRQNPQR
jgi:hypothetical protein